MITLDFDLQINPGSIPPVLHLAQYDNGRTFVAHLKDGGNPVYTGLGDTAKIKGMNGRGVAWEQECVMDTSNLDCITFTPEGAATDEFGMMPVQLEWTQSTNHISTLLIIFDIQKAGYTSEEAARSPEFATAMEEAVAEGVAELGVLLSENQASKTPSMTTPIGVDSSGKLWADTLMTLDAKDALLALFAKCAFVTDDAQDAYDRLAQALSAKLLYIEADYAQDHTIYDTDSLNAITAGDDLIVTAYYDDGSHYDVEGYTLSGTLTAGTSTITVNYGGKTTTIDVTVTTAILFQVQNHEVNKTDKLAVNTGLDLLETDSDFTIVFDGVQPAAVATGSNVRLLVCWSSSTSYKGIYIGTNSSGTAFTPQWYSAQIPSSAEVLKRNSANARFRIIYYHKAGESSATVIQKRNNETAVTSVLSSAFIAQSGKLYIGGQDASSYTSNWIGTITNAIVYCRVLSQDQIDDFMS